MREVSWQEAAQTAVDSLLEIERRRQNLAVREAAAYADGSDHLVCQLVAGRAECGVCDFLPSYCPGVPNLAALSSKLAVPWWRRLFRRKQ